MRPVTKKTEKLIRNWVEQHTFGIITRGENRNNGCRKIVLPLYLPIREKIIHYLKMQKIDPYKKSKKAIKKTKKALARLNIEIRAHQREMPKKEE